MSEYTFPGRRWTFRETLTAPRLTQEEITPDSGWTEEPNLHTLLIDLPGFKETDIKLRVDKPGAINVSGERITRDNKRVHFSKAYNVPEDGDMENITMKFQGEVLRVLVPRVPKEKEGEPEIKDEALVRETAEEKKEEPEVPKEEEKTEEPKMPEEEKKEDPEMPKEKEKKEEPEKPEEEEKKEPALPKEEIIQKTSGDEKQEESRPAQPESNRDQREETPPRSVIGKISEQKGILLASIISFTLGFLLSKRFQPPPPK